MSDNLPLSETSTREEVANYLVGTHNFKDQVKNILINEYISGDVLFTLSDDDVDGIGIKLGPRKKIRNFIEEHKAKIKEKEITEKINIKSTAEEVKDFFEKSLEFTGELNSLDGKGLLELTEEGMKSLGLKFGQRRRLIKYIDYFKTLPPPEEEEMSVSRQSSEEEVSKFLKMRLKFSQDSINNLELDGETLFDLKDEDIDKYSNLNKITLEEKENLKKFLKEEFSKTEEEPEIKLSIESSNEDISKFLKTKLSFSEEAVTSIQEQDLDAETFLALTEKDINKIEGLSDSEKEKLNIFLTEYRNEKEGDELKIDNKNSKEDVAKFLKEKLNFSEKALKDWKLDGQSFLSLIDTEIDKLSDLSPEEKDKLKNYLKEQKSLSKDETTINQETQEKKTDSETKEKEPVDNKKEEKKDNEVKEKIVEVKIEEKKKEENEIKINVESKKEDIIKFLEKHKLKLETLTEEELEKSKDIKKEEKEIIKNFLGTKLRGKNKNIDNNEDGGRPNLQRANKIQDILYDNKKSHTNIKKSLNPKTEINIDGKKGPIKPNRQNSVKDGEEKEKKEEKKNVLPKQVIEQHIKQEERSETLKFSHFKKFSVNQLINAPYNIFFFIALKDLQAQSAGISVYFDESTLFYSSFYIIKINLISKSKYDNDRGGHNYSYLFQIPFNEPPPKKVSLTIKTGKSGLKLNTILDNNGIDNYFCVNNLKYDSYDEFPSVEANSIFTEYLDYFWDKDDVYGEKLKKALTKAFMSKIARDYYTIKMKGNNFFRILKLSSKYAIELKNFEYVDFKKSKVDPKYYIVDEDIDKIIAKRKTKIIELIVLMFLDMDDKYLMSLIKGPNGPDICRSILDLKNEGKKNFDKFIQKNVEDLTTFQKILLSVAVSKNEIEYIINLIKGLKPSLDFIKENIDILLAMENNRCFPINLEVQNEKYDINDIFTSVSEIIKKCAEKQYKIINIEDLFENLFNIASYKDLNELCKLRNFLQFLSKDRRGQTLINSYNKKVHEKGMNLITNQKLKVDEIFNFIMHQDIYYSKIDYNKSDLRDPEIFKYIPIVKQKKDDKEYLKNIKIIKDHRLYDMFSAQKYQVQKKFHEILLAQMKTMSDLKAIFEIFPQKTIDSGFTFLINGKVDELQFTILDEAKENTKILYEVIDNWLVINYNNNLDLNYCCNILEINYDFTSKYYFEIFKSQNMMLIVNRIRGNIINFFLGQNKANYYNAESLTFLLDLSWIRWVIL